MIWKDYHKLSEMASYSKLPWRSRVNNATPLLQLLQFESVTANSYRHLKVFGNV